MAGSPSSTSDLLLEVFSNTTKSWNVGIILRDDTNVVTVRFVDSAGEIRQKSGCRDEPMFSKFGTHCRHLLPMGQVIKDGDLSLLQHADAWCRFLHQKVVEDAIGEGFVPDATGPARDRGSSGGYPAPPSPRSLGKPAAPKETVLEVFSQTAQAWNVCIVYKEGCGEIVVRFLDSQGQSQQKSGPRLDAMFANFGAHCGERLPTGYVKVPSRSRPGESTFFHESSDKSFASLELAWHDFLYERVIKETPEASKPVGRQSLGERRGLGGLVVTANGQAATDLPEAARGFLQKSAMEDIDEGRFVQQVATLQTRPDPVPTVSLAGLQTGGKYDALLKPGKAKELLEAFPQIFARNLPPPALDMFGPAYSSQVFSPAAVADLLQSCTTWDPSPKGNIERIVIDNNTRLIMVGDTHGQLEDVLWIFSKYGPPSSVNRYLFNGDFTDRGGHCIEIILLLMAFRRDRPGSVFMLRGNHEDREVNIHYGFQEELLVKFQDSRIFNVYGAVSTALPIMAHVTNSAHDTGFVIVHGGIPNTGNEGPLTLEQVASLDRRHWDVPMTEKILWGLLWQDPNEPRPPSRGANTPFKPFTMQDTFDFCNKNDVRAILRSHMVKERGWEACHENHCFTIFSASNYSGGQDNTGAVAIISADLSLDINRFSAPPFQYIAQLNALPLQDVIFCIEAWEKRFGIQEPAPLPPVAATSEPVTTATASGEHVQNALQQTLEMTQTHVKNKEIRNRASFVQTVLDLIVLSKPKLRTSFEKLDTSQAGTVSKAQWSQLVINVLCEYQEDILTKPELEGELFEYWGLTEPVNYIRFLARFQVAARTQDFEPKTAGRAKEMVDARRKFESVDYNSLHKALDPDGDKFVTAVEFEKMLLLFQVDMKASQAHTMFEDFKRNLKCDNLSIDNALYCLASVGSDVPPPHDHEEVVARVNSLLREKGMNLVQAFRAWDSSRDGYLQLTEIQEGLMRLLGDGDAVTRSLSRDSLKAAEAASLPPLAQVKRLAHQSFDAEYLDDWISLPPDAAIQILTQERDTYVGYQREDAYPGLLRLARKGATIHPQAGCRVTVLDAMVATVGQVQAPEDTSGIIETFGKYLGTCCNDVDRVNVLEFIRATVPRSFIASLKKVMLRDILRRVWMCKAVLQLILSHRDPESKGELSFSCFRECVTELNHTLKSQGANTMSENHILAVCDVASGGSQVVQYKSFLDGLFIVDAEPKKNQGTS